ncbi:PAS domain-containing protein [Flavobacterium sp. XGLA_31]|uniref:PAS domain-containing protein n=1 Tax=Flavobacterium sp. XGLA_31 TaxID=3447666 RepID=UPI003F398A7C
MSDKPFILKGETFNNIFPFYILIDEKLYIKSFGKSMSKILPELKENRPFADYFTIKRPFLENSTAENFIKNINQLVVINTKSASRFKLRGQFEPYDNGFLFVGSPWFVSMEEVVDNKLTLHDFAYHDPLLDLLHVLKNQEVNNRELKELLITIDEQRKQLKKDKEELNKLSLVASANKNGVVLLNQKGEISWCNEAYLTIVKAPLEELIGKNILDFGPCKTKDKAERKRVFEGFQKGIIFEGENTSIAKDGQLFWYKTSKQPIKDEHGNVVYYFAIFEDITLEKQNEEQVLLLSSIAEKNSNAVIITNEKGETEWVNSSFIDMTGYSFEEILGKKPGYILQGPETDPVTINYLRAQIKNGLPFSCEIINYTKSKEKYWVRIQGQALHNKYGEVIKFFATEEDITFEKEFNQQLIESENRLNSLIANLQSGILLEDENRKIVLVNKKFCELFGIDVEPEVMKGFDCEMMAEGTKDFFKYPDAFLTRVDEIIKGREMVIAEEVEIADGRIFERTFIPIKSGQKYDGHLWNYEDVTIKKKYKESLVAEREKYSNIIANMNMGLIEVDKNDVIQLANQSFTEMSGYTMAELIGQNATDLFLKNKGNTIIQDKVREREKGISDSYEININNKAGEEKYWLISGAPNYNVNGEIIGTIGIHLDITEQKRLELQKEQLLKRLEKQNEYLNEYAQVVSHDLKSPLRSIHTLIAWIKEDNEKEFNPQTKQYLKLIEDKVEKMDYLIQGILTYSKVESHKTVSETINLNEVVQNIIEIIHIPENITVSITNELPQMITDRFRMQQLFQNLISNAVNYCDKKEGLVEIASTEEDNHFIFSIKDNGPGIEAKYQNKIFELFQSFSKAEQSTGIGLSIVKRIVDNYKGKIWMESKLGTGTTFYIKLPKKHGTT